jgi:hypothetical protein
MDINEPILIQYQGGIAFGVIRKRIVTTDENGESTVLDCEIFRQLLDGEKKIPTPVLQNFPEVQAIPLNLFSQYGRAKTFWESTDGFQWAIHRAGELEDQKEAIEVARHGPVEVRSPACELDKDISL